VRRADGGDVHRQLRVFPHENAGGACVVEVDVREEQVPEVAQLETALGQARLQLVDAGGGPAVEQRGPVFGLDEVRADLAEIAEQGVTEVFVDLNFDPRIGNPDADPKESLARATDVLEALAPGR